MAPVVVYYVLRMADAEAEKRTEDAAYYSAILATRFRQHSQSIILRQI